MVSQVLSTKMTQGFALVSARGLAACAFLAVMAVWLLSSTGPFTVDEYFYVRAAQAMADEGAFAFQQFDVAGAPALDMTFAKQVESPGRLAPQYPAGYALIAAPFYKALGIKGLTLVNALAAFAVLLLTFRIALRAGADERTATFAAALLMLSTYWSTYAFAIWPHMLALAVALAVIERALAAGEGDGRAAIAAGLLLGLGQTIRIDMIVLAPAVIVWLRLFCAGKTREMSLKFAAAALIGLVGAALLNDVKDCAFAIFSYENGVAANDVSDFAPLALLAAALLAAVLIFDVRRAFPLPRRWWMLALGVVLVVVAAAAERVFAVAHGFWYSLVDAQSYAHLDRQYGIMRNEWGQLSFYGFSKKALLESIPFAPLLLLPLMRFFRGALGRGEALLITAAGAFTALYAFNETDSGLGLNARFLLPLLPFISIIAALELRAVVAASGNGARPAMIAMVASGLAFLALRLSSMTPGPLQIPLDLYPQLCLAAIVAALSLAFALRMSSVRARLLGLACAAAIGAGAAISATDLLQDQAYRSYVADQERLYRALLPADALVFSSRPALFTAAASEGLSLAYPGTNDIAAEKAVIEAYRSAGRCIYAQGSGALDWGRETGLFSPPEILSEAYSQGGVAALADNPKNCP